MHFIFTAAPTKMISADVVFLLDDGTELDVAWYNLQIFIAYVVGHLDFRYSRVGMVQISSKGRNIIDLHRYVHLHLHMDWY